MRLSAFSVLDHYPDRPRTVPQLYAQVIEECVQAEALGLDSFFVAEHHFHAYGAAPDPAVLLSVLASRTERIRLGPAISVLPFHNPVQVAESYTMIDVLSKGRLVLGVGSGYLAHEFAGFAIDPAEKRERFDEAVDVITRLMRGERVSYRSPYTAVGGVALNVLPLQRPTPPFYVAILREEAAYHVGRKGWRLMAIPYASVDRFADVPRLIEAYHKGRAEMGLEPDPDDCVVAFHAHVAENDAEARANAAEAFDLYSATRLYAKRQTYDDIVASGLALFGSVETVTAKLRRLQAWGIHHVALLMDFGLLPPEHMHRSMTLLAREVLPRLEATPHISK